MSTNQTAFEAFLNEHDEEAWSATLTALLRSIHEVDRNATQIWFAFYPLALFQTLAQSEDPEKLSQQLLMQGNFYLKDQIDTSPHFPLRPSLLAGSESCRAKACQPALSEMLRRCQIK